MLESDWKIEEGRPRRYYRLDLQCEIRYLIGPRLFLAYLTILRIVIAVVLALSFSGAISHLCGFLCAPCVPA